MSPRPSPPFAIPTDCTLDDLLRGSAERHPDRLAIRMPLDDVSFGELDARTTRLAAAIANLVGGGVPVAITPTLGIAFPITLYGTLRCGNIAVTVKQMLRGPAVERLIGSSQVRLAFLTQALFDEIQPVLDRLPLLRAVVLVDAEDPPVGSAVSTLDELLASPGRPVRYRAADPASVAYLHFTHGTTGQPRAVKLSHRNLVANAVQTAHAHELDRFDTVFNHLPIYHCMHLNAPIWASITQVLCPDPDPAVAVEMANAYRARCFYAQPGQLARLAIDPRLPAFHFNTVEVIRTGGTDLKPAHASSLSAHFGVPVIQGYGMVENAGLTHSDKRARPKLGSVGPPVLETGCRVVDLATRRPVPDGQPGEVQIRGPQVAVGYVGSTEPIVDADGWLSTGDVGYLDEDGYLTLVDRLGDLFKVGNELVSPTEIERILLTHPEVQECAVVDYPDQILGRVPYALVVPRPDQDSPPLRDIVEFVNRQVPTPSRIRYITTIEVLPGAQSGKIQRAQLREHVASHAIPHP